MPLGPARCRLCGAEHWNREPHVYGKAPKRDGESPDNDPDNDPSIVGKAPKNDPENDPDNGGQSPGIDPSIVGNDPEIDGQSSDDGGQSTAGNRRNVSEKTPKRRARKRR